MRAAWTWLVCMAVVGGGAGCRRASTPVDPMGTGSRDGRAGEQQASTSPGSHGKHAGRGSQANDDGHEGKPTSVQATEPLTLQRHEFELAADVVRQWWPAPTGHRRAELDFMAAELSLDGRRLALSIEAIKRSKWHCVVLVFDLADPKWSIRTLPTCAREVSFSMDGRHLATYGYPDRTTETYELWDLETLARLGQRHLERPPATRSWAPVRVRGQAVDAHSDPENLYSVRADIELRALGSRRALTVRDWTAFSFQLSGGVQPGYPETLLFGGREDRVVPGDACLVAWDATTGDTHIYETQPPVLRHQVVLRPVPVSRELDSLHLATSATCDAVFVHYDDEAVVYRTGDGQLMFRHRAIARDIQILRTSFVHQSHVDKSFDQLVVEDLLTGRPLAKASLERPRDDIEFAWREMVGDPRLRLRGVELRWALREGPESVGVWIWEAHPG